jgi:hypothetical protein
MSPKESEMADFRGKVAMYQRDSHQCPSLKKGTLVTVPIAAAGAAINTEGRIIKVY